MVREDEANVVHVGGFPVAQCVVADGVVMAKVARRVPRDQDVTHRVLGVVRIHRRTSDAHVLWLLGCCKENRRDREGWLSPWPLVTRQTK